ncbi:putative citrate synthase-like protein [Streptantibioticus cattleyicolor NRRL 8057 = DSM 46488]|nr:MULTISPECIES: citrate synthase [Streptomycetaceae]MYS57957.1 helix-turn-helix domain-containing protein [Streptomyces sp. SID5468]CCB73596.1 putative citrate synthase-like protein [Streptantibioticus cattleyicolor NRRL 8057 = DSM 46488]
MTHHDEPSTRPARLSTKEAARRLGVKPETLYAYVSRGLLTSHRSPGGRGSTFAADEVDALLRRNRRPRSAAPDPASRTPADAVTVPTGITLIEDDRYWFRGVDAVEFATHYGYEETAEWLWTGELRPGIRFTAPPEPLAAAERAVAALPEHSGPTDRLRAATVAAAAADPLRFDLTPDTVLTTARGLIATLTDALPPAGGRRREPGGTVAYRLWSRLAPDGADDASVPVVQAALALLADHDLAASTLAARVAASARAHPYAVVSAGLGALEGPVHGSASGLAHRMLAEVLQRGSAGAVVSDLLRTGRRVPGLGHRLYRGEDPRARMLFGLLEGVPAAADALAAAREVVRAADRDLAVGANVDLALAVLSVGAGLPPEAGETLFAVSRTAGWIAHALEEYAERPLRMRPRGQYDGPAPGQPLPRPAR